MEVDDNARVKVLFEDPATGGWVTVYLEASWCGGHIGLEEAKEGGQGKGYLRVVCDDGVIEATDPEQMRLLGFDGGQTVLPMRLYPGETMSFLGEFEAFIDAVRAGTPPPFDVHFGAEILAIVGAAYYSALQGRAVTIEEFKDFSRSYVDRCGDAEKATEAILEDLLAPYKAT
jgi:predicted dehydrogenase